MERRTYVETISSDQSSQYMQSLCDDLELLTSSDGIDNSISNFVNHVDTMCRQLFGKRNVTHDSNSARTSVHKHLFTNDSTCENKRKEYYKRLNIYGRNKSIENKLQMINDYKNSVNHYNIECSKNAQNHC